MPVETITREEIEKLLDQVRSAAYGGVSPYPVSTHRLIPILEHALAEPARLAAASEEGVREGIERAAQLVDQNYPLTNSVVGGRLSISKAIRALSPALAEAPTTPAVEVGDGWIRWRAESARCRRTP